ncbi:DUF6907 domain-containing protein [Streptomyces sp. cg35]|uniref:DUF6907 domain-containing protein n=1 Tax=Streptomyces sp. cg35 TaxID=3421650 RepID=UPI003D1872F1
MGEAAPRLRPALVNGQRVHLECPAWCTADHMIESVRFLEDLEHAGEMTDLVIPGGPGYRLLAHARLGSDPFGDDAATRSPYVVVDDGSEPFVMSPAEAAVFADRLEVFAQQVRGLGRDAQSAI